MNNKEISAIVDKAARRASEEINEMVQDVSKKIVRDQMDWLDQQMKDILPPKLYSAGRHGDMVGEIEEYLKSKRIKIIFIPDSFSIRIMIGDKIHSQFLTKLTMDDEPIEMNPSGPISS